jgi:heavy metal sensor kinase
MMNSKSLRARLTLWYACVLLLAFSLFGAGAYYFLQRLLESTLEQDLAAQADWVQDLIRLEQQKPSRHDRSTDLPGELQQIIIDHFNKDPRNFTVIISTIDGGMVYQLENRGHLSILSLPAGKEDPVFTTVVDSVGETMKVDGETAGSFRIHIAFPMRSIDAVLNKMLLILAVLAPLALLVAMTGGWFVAGRGLRPVHLITQRAASISVHNLSERLPDRPVDDELGRLTRTFNTMIARLDASFSQMKEFLLNVTHELMTPLTILRGEAELALTHNFTRKDAQELAETFLQETGRMIRIVSDLLTLAKADAGQIEIARERVDMRALVQELAEDAAMLASPKSIEVRCECNTPVMVAGDAQRLRQLFRILLSNAVRYTEPGGHIVLSLSDENGAKLSICDSGIGMSEEEMRHIFDRFYRCEQARMMEKSGSGLGLALAKWIVGAHDGTISVSSEPGKGSCFTVTLPSITS